MKTRDEINRLLLLGVIYLPFVSIGERKQFADATTQCLQARLYRRSSHPWSLNTLPRWNVKKVRERGNGRCGRSLCHLMPRARVLQRRKFPIVKSRGPVITLQPGKSVHGRAFYDERTRRGHYAIRARNSELVRRWSNEKLRYSMSLNFLFFIDPDKLYWS